MIYKFINPDDSRKAHIAIDHIFKKLCGDKNEPTETAYGLVPSSFQVEYLPSGYAPAELRIKLEAAFKESCEKNNGVRL